MGFRKKHGETDLERGLRAQRPQPRDEFVRMLSRQTRPAMRPRRLAVPKIAVIAAVTAVLAGSLGVAGAVGYAGTSVRAFSLGVVHLVSTPKAPPRLGHAIVNIPSTPSSPTGSTTSSGSTSSSSSTSASSSTSSTTPDNAPSQTGQTETGFSRTAPTFGSPFGHQYGFRFPICWQRHIIFVSPRELIWYIFHGARPLRYCGGFPGR